MAGLVAAADINFQFGNHAGSQFAVDFAAQIGAEKVILRQFKSVPPIDGRREAAGKIRFHVFSFLFMFASLSLRHFL